MHTLLSGGHVRLWPAGGSVTQPVSPLPALSSSEAVVAISTDTYARLLSLADQAPLECLPLTPRTLARAKTLGYNLIGQIRGTPPHRLLADLGEDRMKELQRALQDFGMRQPIASARD